MNRRMMGKCATRTRTECRFRNCHNKIQCRHMCSKHYRSFLKRRSEKDHQTSVGLLTRLATLTRENKKLKEQITEIKKCVICLQDNGQPIALYPCGHQCCETCSALITSCHICRSEIVFKIKLFYS